MADLQKHNRAWRRQQARAYMAKNREDTGNREYGRPKGSASQLVRLLVEKGLG